MAIVGIHQIRSHIVVRCLVVTVALITALDHPHGVAVFLAARRCFSFPFPPFVDDSFTFCKAINCFHIILGGETHFKNSTACVYIENRIQIVGNEKKGRKEQRIN